jgi:hypothetical protein
MVKLGDGRFCHVADIEIILSFEYNLIETSIEDGLLCRSHGIIA